MRDVRTRAVAAAWTLSRWALRVASPTWALADFRKRRRDDVGRTRFIRRANATYLAIALVLAGLATWRGGHDIAALQTPGWCWRLLLLAWYPFSRCTEVFVAFLRDAADKLDPAKPRNSLLAWRERVGLALRSYAELVLDFALLFGLAPADWWQKGAAPKGFADALSYSATTITTSGGGGFVAASPVLQALTAYEVACGVILLVVCFTIYTGHALAEFPKGGDEETGSQLGRGS